VAGLPCPTVKRPQTPCFLILAHDCQDEDRAAKLRAEHLDGHLAHMDARALMDGDPYFTSGLYGRVEIYAQTLAVGEYLGGKIWDSADALRPLAAGGVRQRQDAP
jgi:hypothetical protein